MFLLQYFVEESIEPIQTFEENLRYEAVCLTVFRFRSANRRNYNLLLNFDLSV